ncbi:MAG: CapA family protein, partial [Rhodospirillaceae bacterium]|nr:CapA family protein [Rhodospirillaceae bacterium]
AVPEATGPDITPDGGAVPLAVVRNLPAEVSAPPLPGQRPPPPPFVIPAAPVVVVAPAVPRAHEVAEAAGCTVPAEGRLAFTTPIDATTEITIAAVGDVLPHARLQRQAFTEADGFASLWREVADVIAAADIAYANLEGPTARDIGKDGREVANPVDHYDDWVYSSYPMFNYHPRLPGDLAASGFDIVSTANNHSLDRYAIGADRTLEAVTAAGLAHSGTRPSTDPNRPWHTITDVAGRRIAWLACTYGTNGLPDRAGQVLLCFDERQRVLDTLSALASDPDIDAVVLTPHWGVEYTHTPRPEQVELAHLAIEAGAVAVIGNHPHVIQPWERYVANDGREGFIAYSLGNFVSGQFELPRRTSLILVLGLAEDAAGRLAVAGARYVPLAMTNSASARQPTFGVDAAARTGAADSLAHAAGLLPAGAVLPPDAPLTGLTACDAGRLLAAGGAG